jgi:hypothetical protein
MKKYTVTGNVRPAYTSELPCMLRFRCVVLVQDPTSPTMLWYPTSHSISTGVIPGGMKLTTHLNRLPRSGIRAAILLQPLYAFTAWISIFHSFTSLFYAILYRKSVSILILYVVCANIHVLNVSKSYTQRISYNSKLTPFSET